MADQSLDAKTETATLANTDILYSLTGGANDRKITALNLAGTLEAKMTHPTSDGTDHANVVLADSHRASSSNPHSVTKTQVGLANVTNDAQMKKISSSTNNKIPQWDGTTGDLLKDGLTLETTATDSDTSVPSSGALFDHVAEIDLNNQTGTTYELVLSDKGKCVTLTNASAITLTIPANASVAFPVGTQIELAQLGAGQVTVAITSDTLNSSGGATKLSGQYSSAVITKLTSTSWLLVGDITT